MALEPIRFERQKNMIRPSLIMLLIWGLWLSLVASLPARWNFGLDGLAFIIIIGAFWWSISHAAFYLLLAGFLYSAFSLMPAGLFWVVSFSAYLVLHIISFRFSISSVFETFLAVLAVTLVLQGTIAALTAEILNVSVLSWKLLGSICVSALVQALLGLLLARPFVRLIEAK